MNKSIFTLLSCAALATPAMFAEEAVAPEAIAEPTAEAVAEPVAEPQSDFADFLKKMPVKISGYLQTGWNYTSNKNASTSSFQAKRLRLLLDGKVSENVDFRLQIEAFNGIAGSTNGNGQKNIQVTRSLLGRFAQNSRFAPVNSTLHSVMRTTTSLQLLWKLLTSLTSFTALLAATHILTTS